MTDTDNPALQTLAERELNQNLEFETDWQTTQPGISLNTSSNQQQNIIKTKCHNNCCFKIDWESSSHRCVCYLCCLFIYFNSVLIFAE
jgi:hypothetical protein